MVTDNWTLGKARTGRDSGSRNWTGACESWSMRHRLSGCRPYFAQDRLDYSSEAYTSSMISLCHGQEVSEGTREEIDHGQLDLREGVDRPGGKELQRWQSGHRTCVTGSHTQFPTRAANDPAGSMVSLPELRDPTGRGPCSPQTISGRSSSPMEDLPTGRLRCTTLVRKNATIPIDEVITFDG